MRLTLIGFACVGCSVGSPADLDQRSQAIVSGDLSVADTAVVGITYSSVGCEPTPLSIVCTGTLIAPRVVLTAAHCLGQDPPNAFAIYFGASLEAEPMPSDALVVAVSGGHAHPDFDPATHANDIAALILSSDAPAGVTPIAMHRDPLPDLSGQLVRVVGYGVDSATAISTGTRRQGTASVTQIGVDDLRVAAAPAMTCHGDSGGPVLFGSPEDLIGVTTYGDPGCVEYGVAARVDRYVDTFVQPIIDEAAAPRRAFDPDEAFCSTPCATDSDCPEQTVCFGQPGDVKRCVYHGLPPGELGPACTSANECEDACVRVGDGCRRHIPCAAEPTDHCKMPGDDGCGCHTSGTPGAMSLVLLALATAFGARRSRRSPRRKASRPCEPAPRRASRPRH